jgi:hypothetical protein
MKSGALLSLLSPVHRPLALPPPSPSPPLVPRRRRACACSAWQKQTWSGGRGGCICNLTATLGLGTFFATKRCICSSIRGGLGGCWVLDVGGCWIGTLEHMSKTPKQLPTTTVPHANNDNTRFPAKDPHPSHRKFRMEANKLLFIDSFIHPIQIQIQISDSFLPSVVFRTANHREVEATCCHCQPAWRLLCCSAAERRAGA